MTELSAVPTIDAAAPGDGAARSVLLSQEQLRAHARALAASYRVSADPGRSRPLFPRLTESTERLEAGYQLLSALAQRDAQPVASEDWLRDNYHVVQDQAREIRQDLPRKFYAELPKLADGPLAGYPRVYLLARELIANTVGRFDLETVVDFAVAFQTHAALTTGEIWAIPIMLRLGLVEELARLVDGVVAARRSRQQARKWEGALGVEGGLTDTDLDSLLRDELETNGRLSAAFVVELLQWLRDQPPSAAPAWLALQRALDAQGDSAEELLRVEHQREAADQLAMGNVITSMRLLSSIDWPSFFDRVSLVEKTLREDPSGAYAEMDFPTRDRYRHAIEQLSRRSKKSEIAVAERAVALAQHAHRHDPLNDRRHHVGYYLISRGRFAFEADIGYPPTARERLARFMFKHPALGYLCTIAVMTGLGVASLLLYAERQGGTSGDLWLVALLAVLPVSELAISVLHSVLTSQITPRPLPKLAMRGGIPAQHRTIVVVPAILHSQAHGESLLHDLEVRFFANQDPHLHFALLTDYADSSSQSMPEDDGIVESAKRRVDELNERHGRDRFLFFHRARRWNAGEGRWMGWERKRGKLEEFNRLLRGAVDTSFIVKHGDLAVLPSIKYVITLDSDTELPMEAGRRLVGTLSHPLNRPRFDPRLQRVTEGYGVLQPRIGVSVESASRTPFAQVYAGHVGVDPYTTAVSDVYQDVFHEGSYVGKGIYDVDAFQAALESRVPENRLLSHDLFEGFYARAGLCTDIHLIDDYPPTYLAFTARQHRWVRGDWQIVRWLWPTVPDRHGRAVPNTLPAVSRWKIVDNLRRSLLAPALVALFVAGWTVLPGSALAWPTLALLVLAFPAYVQLGRSLSSRVRGVPLSEHVLAERENLATSARQAFLSAAFLLHQSWVMLDAIGRTLVRMLITRRHLLEWVTADRWARSQPSRADVFRRMAGIPAAAVLLALLVLFVAPGRLPLALPVLVLWGLSPALAFATGLPLRNYRNRTSRSERPAFRTIARRTWQFFEDFVGPDDHWLIPDNIQENRREVVAHRTSPTNIGLQLLSSLAAYDFGYLTGTGLLNRLEPTFATLLGMSRYRGHFYNWYDTRTLAPLAPAYVSTVDSGNLAGYLLTLRAGLEDIVERKPLIGPSCLEGLDDAVRLFEEELTRADADAGRGAAARPLKREVRNLRAQLEKRPDTLAGWIDLLTRIQERLSAVGVLYQDFEEPLLASETKAAPAAVEGGHWLERAAAAVTERREELERLAPWATEFARREPGGSDTPARIPSIADLARGTARGFGVPGELRDAFDRSSRSAADLIERVERLGVFADELVREMDFRFLFNDDRQLFSIGFSIVDGRLDSSYYDTLASEARLASFLAIATGQVSPEHWFKLGRSLTPTGRARALLSWSASMFEYLMPLLVMRTYPGTLLAETYEAVVDRQIQYGTQRGVPWGISESAYAAQDLDGNYQYRAFGVPGLGLKRGLADDLVVAPYASLLAAAVDPSAVASNLEKLRAAGLYGRYGFYEAIDYTADRLPKGQSDGVVLLTYMAHHQGMSLVALANALHGSPMQDRFHADPRVQAADLLLQERIPHLVPLRNPPIEKAEHIPLARRQPVISVRRYVTAHTLSPRSHLLSNGSYNVMVTNAGGGYSRRHDLALTRWREDITTDEWGAFCYVRDLDSGDVWSTTYHPTRREPDEYEVTFAPDRAVWRRFDDGIELRTEVVVSPEDDAELRRVSLTNHSGRARRLDVTSYAEVVLAPGESDLAHPAFSNLFIETMAIPERDALIAARRPRSGTDRLYLIHVLSGRGRLGGATEFETARARFLGRGRTLERPFALFGAPRLSGTTGPVLDPIVSLRQSVRIPPGGTARLAFTTGFADSAHAARQLVDKYHDRNAVARALALASTHSQIELRHMSLTVEDTMEFQRLAGRLLYGDPRLRSRSATQANLRGPEDLWRYGISGDLPILLVQVSDGAEVPLVRELLKAHEYLRLKGFIFDLVVLNEHGTSYLQDLQQTLSQLVESSPENAWIDRPGGVFLRRSDLMPPEDRTLLRAAGRVVMDGAAGDLHQQLKRAEIPFTRPPRLIPESAARTDQPPAVEPRTTLEMFNRIGGFAEDGREYVMRINRDSGAIPPAPWSNVVAHAAFGFAATESTTGYTWSANSHDNRLTPWRNDPVVDPPGEAVFIRDEESGQFWSATPSPAGGGVPYTVRHGQGYTAYEHERDALSSTLLLFVPPDDPVKVFQLTLRNTAEQRRQLTVTLYVEWVLGEHRSGSHLHVITSRDAATGALLAQNSFRREFSGRVAFLDVHPGDQRTITGDRTEFIGRNGSLARPAALERGALSDRTGTVLDPCGAVQVTLALAPGETRTVVGLLGDAADAAGARQLVQRYRDPDALSSALRQVRGFWDGLLGTITVSTPDRAMDLMLNRWLPYQTLACRIWGRSAFYQSSGAFGFRDQLQDVLALMLSAPRLVRQHLLHAASRQFLEGDVQHWWHEPGGQGVRTRFSDDRLWLVYATLEYVTATGDRTVLDEQVPFLEGRVLKEGEDEAYETPAVSREHASLYEHCVRAIALNLETGAHGLPLMGTGDWNDGMNLVGREGRGESVWLGWFLLSILRPFADIAASRGEADRADCYRQQAGRLAGSLDDAWDGAWYRRAYFDDGTPLGSRENSECRIDSIAQSWAIIAGGAVPARAARAMESVDQHLVRRDDGLVLLLTPPFDRMEPSPGYIQGYVPGVRENGGQYTHAALWTVLALTRLGDGDRAAELFAMINPVNHTRTPDAVARYRAEPYVVAADVYSSPAHVGRGGWTWYTGSAGWMYRVGIEAILGLTLRQGALHLDPCIPRAWPRFEATVRTERAEFRIAVENPDGAGRGVRRVELDGAEVTGRDIPLADAAGDHVVRVVLG